MRDAISPLPAAFLAVTLLSVVVFGWPWLRRRLRHHWRRWAYRRAARHR